MSRIKNNQCALLLLGFATIFCLSADTASSQAIAVDFTGGYSTVPQSETTLGWDFSVDRLRLVTHLAIWDEFSNGSLGPHEVALWTDTGQLLAGLTVSDTSNLIGTLSGVGGWRYEPLPESIWIEPGQTYVIGMDFPIGSGGRVRIGQPGQIGVTTTSGIEFGGYRWPGLNNKGPGIEFPSSESGYWDAVFGPSFLVAPLPNRVTFAPTLDAQAEWNGSSFDVTDGDYTISALEVGFADIDRRMVMEFDLDAVPDNAVVTSATLGLDIGSFTSTINNGVQTYGTLEFYAYVGDGLLSTADATAGLTLIGESNEITDLGEISLELDSDALTALVQDGAGYLGLIARSGPAGESFQIYTTEGEAFVPESWSAPRLTLAFDWLAELLEGDLNNDLIVDDEDLAIVLNSFGSSVESGSLIDGDPTADGRVDGDDLAYVLRRFGSTPGSEVLTPEPSGTIAILAGLMFACRRRRVSTASPLRETRSVPWVNVQPDSTL